MQQNTHAENIITNLKVKIYLTLPEFSATKIILLDFHVDDSAKGRYDMVLVRDILTASGLNIKFSEHIIESDYGTLKGSI